MILTIIRNFVDSNIQTADQLLTNLLELFRSLLEPGSGD